MKNLLTKFINFLKSGDSCPQCKNGIMQWDRSTSTGEILRCSKCYWEFHKQ